MAIVNTATPTERNWLVNPSCDYSLMFDEVEVTAGADGFVSGTVLTTASKAVGLGDTAFFGVLADDMAPNEVAFVRVLKRGKVTVREGGLVYGSTADATAKAAVKAAMAVSNWVVII